MPVMRRLVAVAMLLAVPGAPVLALDRASDARAAMTCCENDPCAPAIGQAPECCAVSPAAPDERPALKVERAPSSPALVVAVLPALAVPAARPRPAVAADLPPDTSPFRPVVLRL
jgi:hypothetical protein